jgi:hypothetical protein
MTGMQVLNLGILIMIVSIVWGLLHLLVWVMKKLHSDDKTEYTKVTSEVSILYTVGKTFTFYFKEEWPLAVKIFRGIAGILHRPKKDEAAAVVGAGQKKEPALVQAAESKKVVPINSAGESFGKVVGKAVDDILKKDPDSKPKPEADVPAGTVQPDTKADKTAEPVAEKDRITEILDSALRNDQPGDRQPKAAAPTKEAKPDKDVPLKSPLLAYAEEIGEGAEIIKSATKKLELAGKDMGDFMEYLIASYGQNPEIERFLAYMTTTADQLEKQDTRIALFTELVPQRLTSFRRAVLDFQQAEEEVLLSRANHLAKLEDMFANPRRYVSDKPIDDAEIVDTAVRQIEDKVVVQA